MKASHLLILLSLTFIGCGKSGSGGTSTSVIPLKEGETLKSHLENLTLDSNTPEGLGTLYSLKTDAYRKESVGLCTWFLVGADRAVTNSHCIPNEVKNNPNVLCSKYLKGKIQTASGVRTVSCKNLIMSSKITDVVMANSDYALMEIDQKLSDSDVFTLERSGVVEDQTLSVLSMTHRQSQSGVYSEYIRHNCLMKSSDVFGVISSPGVSPIAGFQAEGSLDVCKTVPGNSGSPVVSAEGKLVGILHGGLKENEGIEGMTKNLSIITNLRCQKFNDSVMDRDFPVTCPSERKESDFNIDKLQRKVDVAVKKEGDKALSSQPGFMKFNSKIQEIGERVFVSYDPTCVKAVSQWSDSDKYLIAKTSSGEYVYSSFNQIEVTYEVKIDYYGNVQIKTKSQLYERVTFTLGDLQTLASGSTKINTGRMFKSLPVCN